MFNRNKTPELTERLIEEMKQRHRTDQLARDPSSIPGMTQSELNDVIDTETIPAALLNQII